MSDSNISRAQLRAEEEKLEQVLDSMRKDDDEIQRTLARVNILPSKKTHLRVGGKDAESVGEATFNHGIKADRLEIDDEAGEYAKKFERQERERRKKQERIRARARAAQHARLVDGYPGEWYKVGARWLLDVCDGLHVRIRWGVRERSWKAFLDIQNSTLWERLPVDPIERPKLMDAAAAIRPFAERMKALLEEMDDA